MTQHEQQLSDEDWKAAQSQLRADLDAIRKNYASDSYPHHSIVLETDNHLVIEDGGGEDIAELAQAVGISNAALRARMHQKARDLTDHDWETADPVVIELS